jgi:hypothetical protein
MKVKPFIVLNLFLYLALFSCAKAPSNIEDVSAEVFKAVVKNDVSCVWKMYYDNPGVRKPLLVDSYRSGRITKSVYQKEMGRLYFYKDIGRTKLRDKIGSLSSLIKKLKIKKINAGVDKSKLEKGYFTLKIGEENKLFYINVHFQNINGKYYVVWLYSNT